MGEKGIGKSINNVCYTDWGDPYALEIKLKCKSWNSVLKNKDPIQLFFPGIYEGGLQEQLLTNTAFSSRSSSVQTGEVSNWNLWRCSPYNRYGDFCKADVTNPSNYYKKSSQISMYHLILSIMPS